MSHTILSRAAVYQQRASDTHLGLPRTLIQNVQNATKGQQIAAERAAARKAAMSKLDVRFDAFLFRIPLSRQKMGSQGLKWNR